MSARTNGRRRRTYVTSAAVVLAVAVAGCGGQKETSADTSTDKLEVMSWWTSGSEAAALKAPMDEFAKDNPQVKVTNAATAGGAGSEAIVKLAERLTNGNPPDVWQTFAGNGVTGYANHGDLRDLSAIADDGKLKSRMNGTVYSSILDGGKPYGIPTGTHRGNVLFFNKTVLAKAGVEAPTASTTPAQLITMMQKVKSSGDVPLCLGGKDRFTRVELFENVLLGEIGQQGWKDIADDSFDWRGSKVKSALGTFGTLLDHADPASSGQTWDQAIRKLGDGGCAFASMNDSGYGELQAMGGKAATDVEALSFPGTSSAFIAVTDVFVASSKGKNGKNALSFLSGISDIDTQVTFNREKGSIPVLRDVPVTGLSPYQQSTSKAFWASPVLLSMTHGEAINSQLQLGLFTAVENYANSRDAVRFPKDLEQAVLRVPAR